MHPRLLNRLWRRARQRRVLRRISVLWNVRKVRKRAYDEGWGEWLDEQRRRR